jgi:galactokinase
VRSATADRTAVRDPDALIAALIEQEPAASARRHEVQVVRAPGRVNLIGEHTDYNQGLVLPAAIDLEIRIAYLPTDDGRVELTRLDDGERDGFAVAEDRPRTGTWLDYVAGTAWALREAGLEPRGLFGVIDSNLPANAGLSSSAAIELASAWAMLGDAAGEVDPLDLARICQRAENAYVGVQSGLMDQFAEACGIAGAALELDCRSLDWRAVPIPGGLDLVVCHTGSARRLDGSAYNERRTQCEAAVAILRRVEPSIRSLRDATLEQIAAAGEALDPVLRRRAIHIITENARVADTVAALEADDRAALGRLFAAGHASLRDDFEISSPELDAMVEIAVSTPGVIAARMTGGGFGGCTVNLVEAGGAETLRTTVLADYPARTGLRPTVLPVTAAAGAGQLRW